MMHKTQWTVGLATLFSIALWLNPQPATAKTSQCPKVAEPSVCHKPDKKTRVAYKHNGKTCYKIACVFKGCPPVAKVNCTKGFAVAKHSYKRDGLTCYRYSCTPSTPTAGKTPLKKENKAKAKTKKSTKKASKQASPKTSSTKKPAKR